MIIVYNSSAGPSMACRGRCCPRCHRAVRQWENRSTTSSRPRPLGKDVCVGCRRLRTRSRLRSGCWVRGFQPPKVQREDSAPHTAPSRGDGRLPGGHDGHLLHPGKAHSETAGGGGGEPLSGSGGLGSFVTPNNGPYMAVCGYSNSRQLL